MSDNFIKVNLLVNGKVTAVKIEKGCTFENKGCRYTVDKNGNLTVFDKNKNTTTTYSDEKKKNIKMTGYQLEAFKAVADNSSDNVKGITLSKKDIDLAQQKYDNSKLRVDLSATLPDGYKVERIRVSKENHSVQAYVNNGKESQSATLTFKYANVGSASTPQKSDDQLKPDNGNIVITDKTTTTVVRQSEGTWAIARRIIKEQLGIAPNDETVRDVAKRIPTDYQVGDTIKVPVLKVGNATPATPTTPDTKPEGYSSSFGEQSVFQRILKEPTTTRTKVGANREFELITYDYKIKPGDNLTKIADENDTSISDLKRDNDLRGSKIIAGETLKLRKLGYTVKKGDNLYQIAKKYGLTVELLKDMNDIIDANEIKIGDTIQIPGFVYTVKKGDNLSKIAEEADIGLSTLKSINGLRSNTIQPGQKLVILYNDSDFGNKDVKKTKVSDTETVVDMTHEVGNRKFIQQKRIINKKVVASRAVTDNATLQKYKGGPLTGKTIIINAGHGYSQDGVDRGTPGKGGLKNEWLINYDNAIRIKSRLEAKGAKVIFLQGKKRLIMNELKKPENKADLFISVHVNAHDKPTQDRTQFYYRGKSTAIGNKSKKIASIAERNFDNWIPKHERISSSDKFVVEGKQDYAQLLKAGFDVLVSAENNNIPGMLWETAYMTNKKGRERLGSSTTMDSYATLVTNSVVEYFK